MEVVSLEQPLSLEAVADCKMATGYTAAGIAGQRPVIGNHIRDNLHGVHISMRWRVKCKTACTVMTM